MRRILIAAIQRFNQEVSMQTTKRVGVGRDMFSTIIDGNFYYVDKTRFLRPVLYSDSQVLLFTRPRRFGKTLTMNMIHEFLNLNPENPGDTSRQKRLFKGLDVMKDLELVHEYMGQYPVVFMTLKGVYGESYGAAVERLTELIAATTSDFAFLSDSPKLSAIEKRKLELYSDEDKLQKPENVGKITRYLNFITKALYKHFGRQVVLLIDEYDVPLAKAQSKGYHAQMVGLYSQFLDILKSSGGIGDTVNKIVMTGCLKVAKNSIFTGANNFIANTVLTESMKFSSLMGFTADETEKFLAEFDLSKYADLVKANYDGYHFYKQEIFCPWDVCSFISEARRLKREGDPKDITAANYWIGSENTSTTAIKSYVGFLSENDNQKLQDLYDGKDITITVNDSMNYDSLNEHNVNDMWSLLLHTGYLTAIDNPDGNDYKVKIPNLEIKKCFDDSIQASFMEALTTDNKNLEMLKALSDGDTEKARALIGDLLWSFVSIRVNASKSAPENFYEGFITGILASFGNNLSDLKVEHEAGLGYADLSFCYEKNKGAMVIELKVAEDAEQAEIKANKAIEQIETRGYARQFLKKYKIPCVSAVGIAFFDKDCIVASKKLS